MRKNSQTIIAYFLFLLLSISTIGVVFSAQEKNDLSPAPTTSEEAKETEEMMIEDEMMENEKKEIDYLLPYPGILPDHPFYRLKLLRDKIMDFLIRDPLKRVEFNLLMADKRVNMGIYLAEKGKEELAQKTAQEAEEFFLRALDEVEKTKAQGREITEELLNKLTTAISKHKEVISDLEKKSPEDLKAGYSKVLDLVKQAEEKLQKKGE